ncbi:MAG: mannitol dehydrogenase family protein, partial [Frankiales bacterium]|nr:mannitol dehydrogenase family protein [Frankiales bacterium]
MRATGIVHIGVGNFHRSHQAMYVHRLADPDWSICGVGMLPGDAAIRDGLLAQGGAYSLVLKHPDGTLERDEITSIREYLLAPEDPWAVVARLADPSTRVVSLTITEGGYNVDDATGRFDVAKVAADAVEGAVPTTVFAVVCHALQRRRKAGLAPFTVVSCDNIEGNGLVARTAFSAFAALLDPGLADWMAKEVSFPSCMVDRITPATTDADRALVLDRWGIVDRVPVTAEPFTQWVLEDDFPDGRPALEEVGVQFVSDVRPYELMKLRLLNGSHQAMAYFGLLLGHEHVHEACTDRDVVALLRRYLDEEATPTLEPLPGVDLHAYKATLLERFANAEVADTLLRLAAFGSDRIPKFLLPVIRDNLSHGRSFALSATVVASWLRWLEVQSERGLGRQVVDQWW